MSSSKKVLIIVLFLLLIALVIFGIFSKDDKDDKVDIDYIETTTEENDLFYNNNDYLVKEAEKEDSKKSDNGIDDEIDELEKRIEDVLRLFDPINEGSEDL